MDSRYVSAKEFSVALWGKNRKSWYVAVPRMRLKSIEDLASSSDAYVAAHQILAVLNGIKSAVQEVKKENPSNA